MPVNFQIAYPKARLRYRYGERLFQNITIIGDIASYCSENGRQGSVKAVPYFLLIPMNCTWKRIDQSGNGSDSGRMTL